MNSNIRSGSQMLEEFFTSIQELKNVDKDIVAILIKLHQQGRLTDINLKNELETLRTKNVGAKN